jgi:hypothetical protein
MYYQVSRVKDGQLQDDEDLVALVAVADVVVGADDGEARQLSASGNAPFVQCGFAGSFVHFGSPLPRCLQTVTVVLMGYLRQNNKIRLDDKRSVGRSSS